MIKNLLKYFLILVLIGVFIVSLLGGIMFFFPQISLFGFKFVSNEQDYHALIAEPTINSVDIETNNYDIVIIPNCDEQVAVNRRLRVVFENRYKGYANNKLEGKDIVETLLEVDTGSNKQYLKVSDFSVDVLPHFLVNGKLTLKLIEPAGLVTYGDSRIIVYMPENLVGVEYNLKTNKGAIKFAQNGIRPNNTLSASNITIDVKSSQGSFNLNNANMITGSDLTITNFLGKVDIDSEKIGNVVIKSNSGNFTFKNIGFEGSGVDDGNLVITGNNPYVKVDTIYGSIDLKATTGYVVADTVVGDTIVETENGKIDLGKVLGNVETTNLSGETIIDQIGVSDSDQQHIIINSKSGKIKLGGDVDSKYKGVYNLAKINTESSKVEINNMYSKDSEIETTKGSVVIKYVENDEEKDLKVTTISGAISLYNVYGEVNAKTLNSSKIYVEFSKIKVGSLNTIDTDDGDIELVMPAPTNDTNKQYNLNLSSKRDDLNISIGNYVKTSFDVEKDLNGYYNLVKVFPEGVSTTNTISVKTNTGKLIVKEN